MQPFFLTAFLWNKWSINTIQNKSNTKIQKWKFLEGKIFESSINAHCGKASCNTKDHGITWSLDRYTMPMQIHRSSPLMWGQTGHYELWHIVQSKPSIKWLHNLCISPKIGDGPLVRCNLMQIFDGWLEKLSKIYLWTTWWVDPPDLGTGSPYGGTHHAMWSTWLCFRPKMDLENLLKKRWKDNEGVVRRNIFTG